MLLDLIEHSTFKIESIQTTSTEDGLPVSPQITQGYVRQQPKDFIGLPRDLGNPFFGWNSEVFSDKRGVLLSPQSIEITYEEAITATNFWWIGDSTYHPVDFVVEGFLNDEWFEIDRQEGWQRPDWYFRQEMPVFFKALRLTVTRVAPVGATVQIVCFGPVTSLALDSNSIRDFEVLEDLAVDDESARGKINSNVLSMLIDDSRGWFSSATKDSPFLGLLKPSLRVEVFVGFWVDDALAEFITCGVFYTAEWNPSVNTLEIAFTSYDRLRNIMELPTPRLPVLGTTTIPDLIRRLFTQLGLVEGIHYLIEPSVNAPLVAGWFPGELISETLQSFSDAGSLQINVDRYDRINIRNFDLKEEPDLVLLDTDLLMDTINPQLFRNVFTSVEVSYTAPMLGQVVEVWKMEDIEIDPYDYAPFTSITFSETPIADIARVTITGAEDVEVVDLRSGAKMAEMVLRNNGDTKAKVTVVIYGMKLTLTPSKAIAGVPASTGEKVYELKNDLIQSESYAKQYAARLLHFLQDNFREIEAGWRVNPLVNVGDTIGIQNPTHGVIAKARVTSLATRYAGSIDGSLKAHKSII